MIVATQLIIDEVLVAGIFEVFDMTIRIIGVAILLSFFTCIFCIFSFSFSCYQLW